MQVAAHRTKFCRVYTIHGAAEGAALLSDTSKLFSPKGSGEGISSGRLTEPPHPALPGGAAQGLGTQPTSSPDPWAAEIPSGGQRLCWRGSVAWRCSLICRHGGFPHADGSRATRWGDAAEAMLDARAAGPASPSTRWARGSERCRGRPPRSAPSSPPLRGGNNERGDTGAAPEEGSGLGSTLAQAALPWRLRDQHLPAATRAGAAQILGIHPRGAGASREAGPDPHLRLGGAGGVRVAAAGSGHVQPPADANWSQALKLASESGASQ